MTIEEAIEEFEKGAKATWNGKPTANAKECQQMVEWLKELKQLREQEPCKDAVSREDALQALCKAVHKNDDTIPCSNQRVSCLWDKTKVQDYVEEILRLPPVTPQLKMGQWLIKRVGDYDHAICSVCGDDSFLSPEWDALELYRYCPNCGAKMQEVKE